VQVDEHVTRAGRYKALLSAKHAIVVAFYCGLPTRPAGLWWPPTGADVDLVYVIYDQQYAKIKFLSSPSDVGSAAFDNVQC